MSHSVLSITPDSADSVPKSSMGRMLVDLGKLNPRDAERAAQLGRDKGLLFGEAARRLNLVSEADVQNVLARQFDFPCLTPGDDRLAPELVAAHQPYGQAADILRGIRGQLLLRWFDAGRKALAVVAVNPDDGSSRLCANLAISFAQLGKRTILVDANLHDPQQAELFRLGPRPGLSDLLAGRCGTEARVQIDCFPALSVLPGGVVPPNPQELLAQDAYRVLYENLCAHADVVLLDAPAFAFSAAAFQLATRTGGVLLLVRKNATRMSDVNAVGAQLADSGVAVVGSVLLDA